MLTPRCSVGTLRRSAASNIALPSMVMLPLAGCSRPAMALIQTFTVIVALAILFRLTRGATKELT